VLKKANPEAAAKLMEEANKITATRFDLYRKLAEVNEDLYK
jgi:pyruvate-ferredoxin/flavodoxin oxidoreductase